ncbi:DNA mismatch endonuclease Vsr [Mesorhizobium sp. WSM3864]|uniref:very short patch repair endonuclease n=1 Tax=Mesorhizobium sp. WSM3864 TaxID=2029404 RepID=UPI001FDEC298|nr:DNA mismatch endonuclease Vsr [Mesorhizobium sp. WSM3864]
MGSIRSADTTPERTVRRILHRLGFRFRLHRRDLPGTPDLVLPKYRTVIFVHGCFWHQHAGCRFAKLPASNQEYWLPKLARNVQRDTDAKQKLQQAGWRVVEIWECETHILSAAEDKLRCYFGSNH